jgi:K+-transporting ATPase ATPase B chain
MGDAPSITPGARVSVHRRPHTSGWRVLRTSLTMFDPRSEVHKPVMFVVYVFWLFTVAAFLFPGLFPDIPSSPVDRVYFLGLVIILFLTLWFSHLGEAVAEAQGRAQADSLRQVRSGIQGRQILPDGRRQWVPATLLHPGDTVEVRPGEVLPLDGDVVQGALVIDESMMTGESEPVVRESGGDKTSVLGGSRALQGIAQVRITSQPGQSFLDRMIRLVEGVQREKTPNELALTILLVTLTVAILVVILTVAFLIRVTGAALADLGTLIALLVCLMPTTIGGLLPAIGIAGVNRVGRANIVAKSGRAVEAAGDLDVLILDKTGTITVGNRLASEFIPAPGIEMGEFLRLATLVSAFDDTPEGRSIVRLATRRGVTVEKLDPTKIRLIPFSAERRLSGIVLPGVGELYKGALDAIASLAGDIPRELRIAASDASRQGMTPLAVSLDKRVVGVVLLKDVVKPGIKDRLRELRLMGIRTVMCTGDNRLTAAAIARESGVDEFVAEAKPETKLALIQRVKREGRLVAMTGDGTNDAPALAQADVGLAMNSGTSAAKEAGNMVDLDSDPTKLIEVVSIGKQLLITRGALTTFSVTSDVAKYFALLPAIFLGVGFLNILGLGDPRVAVLATLLFNALTIPLLIPIALRGVRFRPRSASELLSRNLMVYGLGGLVLAFVGIKLLYLGLEALLAQGWVHNLLVVLEHLLSHLP